MASSGSILGNSVLRKEDPGLLTGTNKYFDDMSPDGTAIIHFVRSPIAHANITSIDTSAAESMPGVIAVYTHENIDLADFQAFAMLPPEINRPPLARGTVRLVGDIVAAIVAETRYQAVDAAEAVEVEYEPLPVVVDLEAALAPDAPILFPAHGSNITFATEIGDGTALEGADVVVKERILSPRLAGVPMEANGAVAVPDGDSMVVYLSHQAAHSAKAELCANLGYAEDKLHVKLPWVGGGFGPKAAVYVEHVLTAKAAQKLGRPVKWTETRSENLLSMGHGRAYIMDTQLGLTNDGMIVGLSANIIADGGAYPMIGAVLPMLTQMMSQAVYKMPKIDFKGVTVITNTTPTVAYRGAGRPEATQMVERIMDVAAKKIGMDPAEIRRKNFLQPSEFPLTTLTGGSYDSGEYEKSLDEALKQSGYTELRAEQKRRRDANDPKLLGIGVCSYVEVTAPLGLFEEWGAIEITEEGGAIIRVGTSSHGQGHDTAFSMLVQDVLGIPMHMVEHVDADTSRVPQGAGTMGSRSLQTAGSCVYTHSQTVLAAAKTLAAKMLEANEADIVVGDGALQVAGVPAKAVTWAELAVAAKDPANGVEGGGLAAEGTFSEGDSTFPFGSHVAVVEVDSDTGDVTLVRHVAVDDCGRILDPMLVRGQQAGGIAQGAAQALYEEVRYDEDGNPQTGNLMDYLMPSAAELPSFEMYNTETDSPRNPLGAKGIGESGTIGSTPAVHNAVCDAVSHLGITHVDMPCSPEKVWRAIAGAAAG